MDKVADARQAMRAISRRATTDRIVDPHFEISLDDTMGIVRTGALTFQSAAEVDHYVGVLAKFLETARHRYGRALVLADLCEAPVRSQEAVDRLRSYNQSLYRKHERVALLVESSLLKLQLRRNLVPDLQNIFMSRNAAETWLQAGAYDPRPALAPVQG